MSPGQPAAPRGRREKSFRHDGGNAIDDLIFRLRARRVLRRFPDHVDAAADLGCGYDYRLLRYLRRAGRIDRGIAVDLTLQPDPPAGIATLESDLGQPLAIPDASVDVVFSLAVVEHLDDAATHLREARRILRSPGKLLLTSPSRAAKPVLELLAFRLHLIDADEIADHRHYFNEQELRAVVAEAGFAADTVAYGHFLFGLNQWLTASV